jgi:hypothetical protein
LAPQQGSPRSKQQHAQQAARSSSSPQQTGAPESPVFFNFNFQSNE